MRSGAVGEYSAKKRPIREGIGRQTHKSELNELFDRVGEAENFSKFRYAGYQKDDKHDENGPMNFDRRLRKLRLRDQWA